MIDLALALEQTALARALAASRWAYPLVNAGHVLGLALLVGAVVPMDVRLLRGDAGATWLRPFAAAGLALAAATGALLFAASAADYVQSGWFRAKVAAIGIMLVNVALHPRLGALPDGQRRVAAALSIVGWPAVLVLGRMIGYG